MGVYKAKSNNQLEKIAGVTEMKVVNSTLKNIDLDTYNYQPNERYQTEISCTNGPLATVVPYHIECLPIINGFLVRFTDNEGHQFTRKKINGTWDSTYSCAVYQ